MTASTCGTCGGGLDAEQLRLILSDVNTSHRDLVEELRRRLQAAENARDSLQSKLDQCKASMSTRQVQEEVAAHPDVIWATQKEREAREKELADLKEKVCELEKQVATLTAEKTSLTNEKTAWTAEKSAMTSEKLNLQAELAREKAYVELLEKAIINAPYFGKPEMPKRQTKTAPGATA